MVGIPWICSISRTEPPTQIWTTEDRYRQQSFQEEYSIRRISTNESYTYADDHYFMDNKKNKQIPTSERLPFNRRTTEFQPTKNYIDDQFHDDKPQ